MEFAIWLIVGLVIGGAIGALATWWISRARGGAVSVMQLKQENDKFRNEVTEHFVETARLINQMTDSYKQVFDHLSSGAEKLVDDKSLAERLPPASGREVRLSEFGAAASGDSARSQSGQAGSGAGQGALKPEEKLEESREKPDPLKGKSGGQASDKERREGMKDAAHDAGKREVSEKSGSSASQPSNQASDKSRSSD